MSNIFGLDKFGIIDLPRESYPSQRTVLALDPGGVTGGAVWIANRRLLWFETPDLLTIWKILTENFVPQTVIFERFVPEIGTPWDETALMVQGIVTLWQAMGNHVIWQYRSVVGPNSVVTDELLKHHDLWIRGAKDARAAIKHLIKYLIDHGDVSWVQHLKPTIPRET